MNERIKIEAERVLLQASVSHSMTPQVAALVLIYEELKALGLRIDSIDASDDDHFEKWD